ncbi:ABC transporter transmembrane region [Popillia japonica]|uniref:ABC transporter transmembrane region n=1 Tax=Popillia japonica TaxID=7064 RepID=A0AAW1MHX6_POPJA
MMESVSYTFDIFKKGYKNGLQEEDLYDVFSQYKSSKLGDTFEDEWNQEILKPKPALTKVIVRKFGKTIIGWGFLKMAIRVIYMVSKPLAIGKLVSYFSPGSTVTLEDAYRYALVITIILIVQPLFNHTYYIRMMETAQRIRIGLCSLVYRKSLRLNTSSLIEISNGRIVTIITKDVMLFESMLQFVNEVWIGTIQVIVMTYVMYLQIGVPAIIGIGFLVVLTPLQGIVAKYTMKTKLKTLARSDERIRLIQEILSTIQIIKIYTWENYFNPNNKNLHMKIG